MGLAMSAERSTGSDDHNQVDPQRKIKVVVEVDSDGNVKVCSDYTYIEVELVKWEDVESDGAAKVVETAKRIAVTTPHEIFKEE